MNVSGPIKKLVVGHSTCGSASIGCLDWRSWYLDSGFGDGCYLHVRHLSKYDGVTYHRVYPRKVRGRVCHRIAMLRGRLYWLHDLPNTAVCGPKPSAGLGTQNGLVGGSEIRKETR